MKKTGYIKKSKPLKLVVYSWVWNDHYFLMPCVTKLSKQYLFTFPMQLVNCNAQQGDFWPGISFDPHLLFCSINILISQVYHKDLKPVFRQPLHALCIMIFLNTKSKHTINCILPWSFSMGIFNCHYGN